MKNVRIARFLSQAQLTQPYEKNTTSFFSEYREKYIVGKAIRSVTLLLLFFIKLADHIVFEGRYRRRELNKCTYMAHAPFSYVSNFREFNIKPPNSIEMFRIEA